MPELPEVETIRGQLEPRLVGRRITEAGSLASEKFLPARDAAGRTVARLSRRGKYLIVALSGGQDLVVHLGMTGRLQFTAAAPPSDGYVRAWWSLDDGAVLELHDVRRFGRVRLVPAGCYDTIPTLAQLGPEPLGAEFDAARLWAALRQSRRRVKTQLLSQRPVAGLGNIYADEALWRAGINPAKRRITRAEAAALHAAIPEVLRQAIAHRGTTFRDYRTLLGPGGDNYAHLDCYGRGGEPCRRCGAELRSRVLDARNTTYCPSCQR
ncbi:MAG: bifunctional DNA-formamidopyrimidine glycosylase/DNA-(apurinic or apyrimidinic site) lyase [Acidimicrobiia bacterium]|nr:bifunctional DNA-formamidopyrimidine glycosylase/DNA-(apurinic or apyrimidinic site) lyase [Acidimicrobiia bacterium]